MADGLVIDTDVICKYSQQCIDEEGDIYYLIERMRKSCGIAITDFIEHQWNATCGSQLFNIWFTDNVRDGYIKYVKPYLSRDIIKQINNGFGLPQRGKDIELIKASNVTYIRYILTTDIDLFDPKKKKASSKEKKRIKKERSGSLCKYLKKKLNIRVGLPEHCSQELYT
ncbi:MAG: hypothetical protein ACFFG0_41850 [Candidatus Thorarchaeota archaeon]